MIFKINNERFNTDDMLTFEVDGSYRRLFLYARRNLLFMQAFDPEFGITVRSISFTEVRMLMKSLDMTGLPDALSFTNALIKCDATNRLAMTAE